MESLRLQYAIREPNCDLNPRKRNPIGFAASLAVFLLLTGFLYYSWRQTRFARDAEARLPRTLHPFRLAVKLATDPEANGIEREPAPITLEELVELPHRSTFSTKRMRPLETQVWQVEVTVTRVEFRPDGDVLFEIEDGKVRTEMEVPEPSLARESPFYDQIARIRREADEKIDPVHRSIAIHRRASVTGVGFAGLRNSRSPSGVRLYPLLSIAWKDSSGSAR